MNAFLSLLSETYRRWNANRGPRMGAALAFYTVFSLAPLAILMLALISLVVERNLARAEMVEQFRSLVGHEGADMVEMILTRTAGANAGVWGTLFGFAVLLVGASSVFGELQDSLNQIWEVPVRRHPVFMMIKERAISFALVLVMSLLMLISFLLVTVIAAAGNYLHGLSPNLDRAWELGNSGMSLLALALLFALIFHVVPDARITWKDVWPGALMTAVLFVLGKFILGIYFGWSAIASSYGAAGSLIIILVWVFYSAQILFFGAEFTHVYALRHGSHRNDKDVATAD